MKYCKYRLPCDWCDKFEKKCDKVKCKCTDNIFPDPYECKHDWIEEHSYLYYESGNCYKEIKYRCRKCVDTKIEKIFLFHCI